MKNKLKCCEKPIIYEDTTYKTLDSNFEFWSYLWQLGLNFLVIVKTFKNILKYCKYFS